MFSLVGLAVIVAGVAFAPSIQRWLYPPAADQRAADIPVTATADPVTTPTEPDAPATTTAPPATPSHPPATSSRPTSHHVAVVATPMPGPENAVLTQTNQARATAHCAALRMDSHLLAAARLHSADMAQNNYFSHDSPDGRDPGQRMTAAGYPISGGWAENIALGYPTADAVMAGWLSSKGHRDNILNCALKSIGVGVARGADGRLYWTQDFGGR